MAIPDQRCSAARCTVSGIRGSDMNLHALPAASEAAVAAAYEQGKAINMAAYFEIDDVIDPADSRRWIATLFDSPSGDWRTAGGKRRAYVDGW